MLILAEYLIGRDLTFTIGGQRFGFMDANHTFGGDVTLLFLGPIGGYYSAPCSAMQGTVGASLIACASVTSLCFLSLRRRVDRRSLPA